MITFENGALTTDATLSITDTQAVFQFADYCMQQEQERIIKLLDGWSCGLDDCPEWRVNSEKVIEFCNTRNSLIALIKGEK